MLYRTAFLLLLSLLISSVAARPAMLKANSGRMYQRGLNKATSLKSQITAQAVTSATCQFCEWVVEDIQDALITYKSDLLNTEVTNYLNGLCAAQTASAEPFNRICRDVVRRGIASAVGLVTGAKANSRAICQAVSLCSAPSCPTGFTPLVSNPSQCYLPLTSVDTYPSQRNNCTALGGHVCTFAEVSEITVQDYESIGAGLVAAFGASPPSLVWLGSKFLFNKYTESNDQDPRIFDGVVNGENPFYQAVFGLGNPGGLGVTSWIPSLVSPPTSANSLLPYNPPTASSFVVGAAVCCAQTA